MSRILLVDDDPALRAALGRVLSLGNQVTAVGSAGEALAAMAAGETGDALGAGEVPFDVVVCDVMMPTENGLVLHAAVASRFPELSRRFVFITGGTSVDPELEALGLEVVLKPFSLVTIEAAIARVLR